MEMTWIVFTIKDQQVYQIEYRGCAGQDLIDGYKTMIAGEYKVQEQDVQVSFKDDLKKTTGMSLKTRVTSSKLVQDVQKALNLKVSQN